MKKKIVILVIIVIFIIIFKNLGLEIYLNLDYIKENRLVFADYYSQHTLQVILIYFSAYVLATALSLPGATILTLLGGALFGLGYGLLIISFASTIGATISFVVSRTLFRDYVQTKFENHLKTINAGVEKDGSFYLFTLRLIPLFPFFFINLVMGVTNIKVIPFYLISQIGMLPGTLVFVNAGVQLGSISYISDIMSFKLLLSFALLGIFPLIAKKIVSIVRAKKVYQNYKKPDEYDYNMVVIGAGAAGLVTSYICAAVKSKVALIEKDKMGGDCLNTGCVPSKALIKAAKVVHSAKTSEKFGVSVENISIDFKKVMGRVHNVIADVEPHDSVERYSSLGVECVAGEAEIISPWEVKVGDRILKTKNITIATGASPFVPPIKGIDQIDILTSNNLWKLEELPENFVVLGGGPIGLEMAQSFARLGSKVTVVEMGPRIMPREDEDVAAEVTKLIKLDGVNILTGHMASEFIGGKDGKQEILVCKTDNGDVEILFDKVLVAVGRKANLKGFGLKNLDISIRKNGTIEANEFLQTNYPNIFVCGDVTGPYQLTHTAAHQAWYCAVNGLFQGFKKFKVDYSVIPWCTYTDPEVATVGKNELICEEEGLSYDVTKYQLDDLDRAIAEGATYGFVKVLTKKGSDHILGATIVGQNAGELLTEFVSAMKHDNGLNAILGTIHSYPTMAEANKYVAGNWKKANSPEKVLRFLAKFHAWRRS